MSNNSTTNTIRSFGALQQTIAAPLSTMVPVLKGPDVFSPGKLDEEVSSWPASQNQIKAAGPVKLYSVLSSYLKNQPLKDPSIGSEQ